VRSGEEWKAAAQGAALANTPPIVLRKIGSAAPLRLSEAKEALTNIHVLDLTRVLAGPTVGRTLASYGADILQVRSEKLPTIECFDLDTGHGKRSINLELHKPGDAERLRQLARGAHIFVDSYRPGALSRLGFSPLALAHSNPGMIYVAVSAYGHEGPWAARRGWEQMAQAATGLAHEQGAFLAKRAGRREAAPRLLPAAACDYITGYLGAAGAIAALLRRVREGGSWLVEVSLCATAMWLRTLGRADEKAVPDSWQPSGLDAYMKSCETTRGRLEFLGPVVRMAQTPPVWRRPPPMPSADEVKWLAA
jgi:crotonobetainyl-CoA:carnitine CoA-transferase CaiB-like acyl-CoA transferase